MFGDFGFPGPTVHFYGSDSGPRRSQTRALCGTAQEVQEGASTDGAQPKLWFGIGNFSA